MMPLKALFTCTVPTHKAGASQPSLFQISMGPRVIEPKSKLHPTRHRPTSADAPAEAVNSSSAQKPLSLWFRDAVSSGPTVSLRPAMPNNLSVSWALTPSDREAVKGSNDAVPEAPAPLRLVTEPWS
jgi:hypothetical protein